MSFEIYLLEVRKKLKSSGLTQKELADKLGVSHITVSNILTGKKGSLTMLKKITEEIDSLEIKKKKK